MNLVEVRINAAQLDQLRSNGRVVIEGWDADRSDPVRVRIIF